MKNNNLKKRTVIFITAAALILTGATLTAFAADEAKPEPLGTFQPLGLSSGLMLFASSQDTIDLSDLDTALSTGAASSSGTYSYDITTKVVTISSGSVTVTGSTTERQVVVTGATEVTLNNASIQLSDDDSSAFALEDGATVTLNLVGKNILKSGKNRAGLETKQSSNLTITAADTNQTLEAQGGMSAAGIGGGSSNGNSAGTITINGGAVTANGGAGSGTSGGAGIGTGEGGGTNNTIIINGGKVTANGGGDSAGIGSGDATADGTVEISGGTVLATGPLGGHAIGYGAPGGGGNGTVTITGGSVNAYNSGVKPEATNSGKPLYYNTLTLDGVGDEVAISDIKYGDMSYGHADVVTQDGGNVYVWLPSTVTREMVSVVADGKTYQELGSA